MDITTRPDLIPLLANPVVTPSLTQGLAKGLSKNEGREEALKVSRQFEAFFLRTVLEDIVPEPSEDAFGGGSHAEKLWNSMMNEQYANLLAENGGVGIAALIYEQILALQEGQEKSNRQSKIQQQSETQQQATFYKLGEESAQ